MTNRVPRGQACRRVSIRAVLAIALSLSGFVRAYDRAQPAASQRGSGRANQAPVGQDWTVSQRVDADRIVVLFGGGELYVPQAVLEASSLRTRTRTPGPLVDVPADRVASIVGDAARVGDRWTVDAGRRGHFHFTAERLVIGYKDCGEAWGVLAAVAPEERARFEAVSEKYYIARLARPDDAAAVTTRLGPVAFALGETRRAELSALLERERLRTWPEIRHEAEASYTNAESRRLAWPSRWRAIDARLDRGDSTLEFDVQAFRLTPDGDPRLFVRARWMAAGYVAYAMTAWVRAGATLSLENSDVSMSKLARWSEFQGIAIDSDRLGLVLNVFDRDGDGRAEILMSRLGYESRNLELFVYTAMPGLTQAPILRYEDGC